MYAQFESDEVISISGLLDPVLFFEHLGKLLPQKEYVVGLGCFNPIEALGKWLRALPPLIVPERFDYRHECDINKENDWGGAFYFQASESCFAELAGFARQAGQSDLVCAHVIAFLREDPILSFHDAFLGDDMVVSLTLPQEQIDDFCSAVGTRPARIKNPHLM